MQVIYLIIRLQFSKNSSIYDSLISARLYLLCKLLTGLLYTAGNTDGCLLLTMLIDINLLLQSSHPQTMRCMLVHLTGQTEAAVLVYIWWRKHWNWVREMKQHNWNRSEPRMAKKDTHKVLFLYIFGVNQSSGVNRSSGVNQSRVCWSYLLP